MLREQKIFELQFGGECFRQTKGIPQGSCISTDLANLYLASLDRSILDKQVLYQASSRKPPPDVIVLRFLDDYLCVATQKDKLLATHDKLTTGNMARIIFIDKQLELL